MNLPMHLPVAAFSKQRDPSRGLSFLAKYVTPVVVILVVSLSLATFIRSGDAANASAASSAQLAATKETQDVASCRSSYNVELQQAIADLLVTSSLLIESTAAMDQPATDLHVAELAANRAAITAAADNYDEAATLAREDPEEFLEVCESLEG